MPRSGHDYPAWAEINLAAIRHNYRQLKESVRKGRGDAKKAATLMPVIKADAYGHGMMQVATLFDRLGVGILGVSDVDEGVQLRKLGIRKRILLLESPLPPRAREVVDYELTPTVCSVSFAAALDSVSRKSRRRVGIHIKVDTGMGRLGVWHSQAEPFIQSLAQYRHLFIEGIYTHFPLADSNPEFTKSQIDQLSALVARLAPDLRKNLLIHAANSMGTVGYRNALNLARPGLMLYGLYPAARLRRRIPLKPAMSVKARIIHVKPLLKGCGVSYGHTFVARRDMQIAILPIGYSNGYFRSLSNKAKVLIAGKPCPIIGNVTMDQIVVDISACRKVKIGDVAVLLGSQQKTSILADDLAAQAGTINYEIVCSLGNGLPRVYVNKR